MFPDFSTLGHIGLALITLMGGLLTGWLAKGTTTPPAGGSPPVPPATLTPKPLQRSVMDTLIENLSASGTVLNFPGADQHVTKQQLFHTLAQSLLSLPLGPVAKGKAIQDLVGFLDKVFTPPPPPPPMAE